MELAQCIPWLTDRKINEHTVYVNRRLLWENYRKFIFDWLYPQSKYDNYMFCGYLFESVYSCSSYLNHIWYDLVTINSLIILLITNNKVIVTALSASGRLQTSLWPTFAGSEHDFHTDWCEKISHKNICGAILSAIASAMTSNTCEFFETGEILWSCLLRWQNRSRISIVVIHYK